MAQPDNLLESSITHYLSTNEFKNKHIILTGGTGGIGQHVLKSLLQLGATLACISRNKEKFPSFVTQYQSLGQFIPIQGDLSKPTTINTMMTEAMIKLGGKLDSLILCHGKFIFGSISQLSFESFDEVMNINVRSNFHLLNLAVPFLKYTKGNVVMVSSVEAKVIEKDNLLHSLSKSMVNSLVQNAALELASFGIRVNAVAPGIVNTQHRVGELLQSEDNLKYIAQMGRFCLLRDELLEPSNVADGVLFLASSESAFMTGEVMVVDGGFELNHDCSFAGSD